MFNISWNLHFNQLIKNTRIQIPRVFWLDPGLLEKMEAGKQS